MVGVVQEGFEVVFVEAFVAPMLDRGFDHYHAVEIAQEVRALNFGGINTLVTEFAEEAPVAIVDGIGDTAEIADEVVGGTSVDMIDSHTGRDLLIAPGDIDGMGSKDIFTLTEGILELQIPLLALRIVNCLRILVRCHRGILQHFPSVGIDTHTDDATASAVDIEGDVVFGVRADIAHIDVVKGEGQADKMRLADDFKAALSQAMLIRNFIHKHRQSGGINDLNARRMFRKAVQK